MTELEEIMARRKRESEAFYASHSAEEIAAIAAKTIEALETRGYSVHKYDNYEMGVRSKTLPVAYEILDADYNTVYGYGTCDVEQLTKFLAWVEATAPSETKSDEPTRESTMIDMERQVKEREYDEIHNEGAEGYNPYRLGSAHTYKG